MFEDARNMAAKEAEGIVSIETNNGPASLQKRSMRRIMAFISRLETPLLGDTVQIDTSRLTYYNSPISLNPYRFTDESESRDTPQENDYRK